MVFCNVIWVKSNVIWSLTLKFNELILEGCCIAPLTVMPRRTTPLGIEIDAVVVQVPSHVQEKSKEATKQVLGIKDEAARCAAARCAAARFEGDAAAGGGTPCARGGHAMEPERRRHQFQSLRALFARASL